MKLFFDTEFTGLHQNTTLISIGIVDEEDRTFYAEFIDYDSSQINDWIRENVIKNLLFNNDRDIGYTDSIFKNNFKMKGDIYLVKDYLTKWFDKYNEVEMWGDFLAYDWVLFCQIWGGAFNIPKYIYRNSPFDICTLMKIKGIDPNINREKFVGKMSKERKHNALWDAKIIKACYNKLMEL